MKKKTKRKLHNWFLICTSWIAAIMCTMGAMGLDGDYAWLCFGAIFIGAFWLIVFFYANKERFEVW